VRLITITGSNRGRRGGRAVQDGDGGLSSFVSLDSWLLVFMQDLLHGGRQRIDLGSKITDGVAYCFIGLEREFGIGLGERTK